MSTRSTATRFSQVRRLRIALLCDRYPPRPHTGIGTFVQMMARGLRQRGHDVLAVDIADRYSENSDHGVPVYTLPRTRLRWLGNLVTRLRLRAWLAARVRCGGINLVEAPDYPGLLPFGVPGCATVIRLHQTSTISHRLAGLKMSPGISFYERRTLAANRNWIAVSSHILSLTQKTFGLSPRKSAVIHNGIEPMAPDDHTEVPHLPARFVLYAGQVSERKGSLVLAEAARAFLLSHPEVHLVYAGGCLPEPGAPPIERRICCTVGAELAKRIHFLGQLTRQQTLACMRRATAFVFPALIDCFPFVVLEAMSCGLPVVFTSHPPGPEMIEDGISGLLADPACPADFAEKTARLLDHPDYAAALAANSKKRVAERFSFESCLQATERFYQECMQEFLQSAAPHRWPAQTFPVSLPRFR